MENNESFLTRLNQWIKESITLKLISMGFLILILLIPTSMITGLVQERQQLNESVIEEVSSDWSSQQTIVGPLLIVPYKIQKEEGDEIHHAIFLPADLNINGSIIPEIRKRSIYEVVVYGTDLELSGKFENVNFKEWNVSEDNVLYDEAYLITGISDLRGIKENIVLEWNNQKRSFDTGFDNIASTNSGIRTKVSVGQNETYLFKYNLKLNGSQSIYFVPIGKETTVALNSSWKDPKFTGAFLPEKHTISTDGFSANWKVLHFNRTYPQKWVSNERYNLQESSEFGVNLLLPVDHYQKTYRSAKYAVLIISLTFLVFFFIEVLNKKRIHPFQYILVGVALIVFYTLLLSLSEHLGFSISYFISAIAIVGLITFYLKGVLNNTKISLISSGILALLYTYIFIILQLQDFALLAGSIGLFAILSVVMLLSRNINWYEPENQGKQVV